MPETFPRTSSPAALHSRAFQPSGHQDPPLAPPYFRSRIGTDLAGGFYPAPHRYQLYLSPGCPRSLRISVTLDLLRLRGSLTTSPVPLGGGLEAPTALRRSYEATRHHFSGPFTAPALCDRWTGRVVSNHTPDILRDLAEHLATDPDAPVLRPPALAAEIDTIRELLDEHVTEAAQRAGAAPASQRRGEALRTLLAALDLVEGRLGSSPYLLGDDPTAADVELWVTLVHLDAVHRLHLDAETVEEIARYDGLWAYVRRLHRHPAFHGNFRADHMTALHRLVCRGPQGSGAAVALPGVLGG